MLSKTSRCHTFDAHADGFIPGEGCGVILLKRLADALADGDPVRAVIRGTAVNHDGRTTVLTAPSGLAHEAVIRRALKNGAVEAEQISFVETHGTGTSLGDPIELQALQSVYGPATPHAGECLLGAVKSNLGHLEAAAGFAGLIKVVLAMEHGSIPKNLHFTQLNPQSSLAGTRLKIAEQREAWPRGPRARLAGVSSLGFGGTNAHVIVEEAPLLPSMSRPSLAPRSWQRVPYWLPSTPQAVAQPQKRARPLSGVWLDSPFLQGRVFEIVLDDHSVRYTKQHLTAGESIVSSDVLLKLIYPILQDATGKKNFQWLETNAGEPLSLTVAKRVQISINDGHVKVVSETATGWRVHLETRFESAKEADTVDRSESVLNRDPLSSAQIEARISREAAAVMEISDRTIPRDVPLINLGLDSMMAVDLRNRLQAFVGQELSPNFVFNNATVSEMAREIGARLWAASNVVGPLSDDETKALTEEVEL